MVPPPLNKFNNNWGRITISIKKKRVTMTSQIPFIQTDNSKQHHQLESKISNVRRYTRCIPTSLLSFHFLRKMEHQFLHELTIERLQLKSKVWAGRSAGACLEGEILWVLDYLSQSLQERSQVSSVYYPMVRSNIHLVWYPFQPQS